MTNPMIVYAKLLRHSILTQVVHARFCIIQSLHKLFAVGTASSNPYTICARKGIASFNPCTSFVRYILRHPILTQFAYARYCVIQSLHKFFTLGVETTKPDSICSECSALSWKYFRWSCFST